jgi:hypothetical protein
MTNRQQLIKRLLTTFHLNVVDRQIFKDQPITLTEIRDYIKLELIEKNIFPISATDTKSVFEGHFIEKVSDKEFKLHWQRHQATNPFQLAERNVLIYTGLDKLVHDYIDKEYKFNIDGLTINET